MADVQRAMELSDTIIQCIRARATGANVHAVNGLIGAYRMSAECAARFPAEPQWAEARDRAARDLYAFYAVGRLPCRK